MVFLKSLSGTTYHDVAALLVTSLTNPTTAVIVKMPDYGAPKLPFRQVTVSGIELDVFGLEHLPASGPVAVAFHLHGRLGKKGALHPSVAFFYEHLQKQPTTNGSRLPLVLVCMDQRNHGTRQVDALRNYGWREDPPRHNPSHAADMYSTQMGTAQDVSLVMDFLPAVLFPNDEHSVDRWICMGV